MALRSFAEVEPAAADQMDQRSHPSRPYDSRDRRPTLPETFLLAATSEPSRLRRARSVARIPFPRLAPRLRSLPDAASHAGLVPGDVRLPTGLLDDRLR